MRPLRGFLIAVCVFVCAAPVGAIVAGDVAAAHEQVIADSSFQLEFASPSAPKPAPGWLQAIARLIAAFVDLISPLIEIVFWLGVALIIVGAIYLIGREIWLRTRRAENNDAPVTVSTYKPEPSLARALLEEADRLAAKGRYGEAVHVLLFRSVEDIQKFQPNYVRKAMTSREISRLPILPSHARSAFSQIAAAVERSHFAGREISADIFSDCRAAYLEFAQTSSWR
ncbi:MAG: DUF4129 domain-containing protein [Pseudomonadota bacterium]